MDRFTRERLAELLLDPSDDPRVRAALRIARSVMPPEGRKGYLGTDALAGVDQRGTDVDSSMSPSDNEAAGTNVETRSVGPSPPDDPFERYALRMRRPVKPREGWNEYLRTHP